MKDSGLIIFVIYTTLIILILVIVVMVNFILSGRRRHQQRLELTETKLNFERELRQVETEVSEQVMGRFAQELHDNIGQLLTATHIQIENQKIDHPDQADGFKPIEIYLGEVTQQLRLLSRTLNHDYLGHIGLLAAIQMEAERLVSLKRFAVHLQPFQGVSTLDKNQELMVFRIFQEITQNALRHSGAKNLFISVNMEHGFELSVKDDGHGFDKETILRTEKASGLRNIIKRASLAGMSCEIMSAPGEGSLFILKKLAT